MLILIQGNQLRADSDSPKKSHGWLIAVGAGAGTGLGFLIGFQAFDESINSDRKIWTTTILSGVAGGVIGWLLARHMDREAKTAHFLQRRQDTTRTLSSADLPVVIETCSKTAAALRLPLVAQADCYFPPLGFTLKKS